MYLETVLTTLVAFCCLVQGHSHHDRLVKDLTKDYLVSVDPGNIVLKFNVALVCARYDAETHELFSSLWESYAWVDSRLRWIPSEYGGIPRIRLPSYHIWKPDMRLYTSLEGKVDREETNIVLESDGSINWVPPASFKTPCAGGAGGEITCEFRYGSWTYDTEMIDLEMQGEGLDLSNYNKACPLVVKESKASVVAHHYPCCKEAYPSLDMNITFTHRA